MDSGVGGLSILRALQQELPAESFIYIADQAHLPYGPRPLDELRAYGRGITKFLLAHHNAKAIVVACNAASAASLNYLRETFPDVPFIGMEPALKPAASATQSGVVGVLTTAATAGGPLYNSVKDRFAAGVTVHTLVYPELVQAVEENAITLAELRPSLERILNPALAQGADQIVLGCTHFPFAINAIQAYVGPDVAIIDPSPAVARQTRRVLEKRGVLTEQVPATSQPTQIFYTTGDVRQYIHQIKTLLNYRPERIQPLTWHNLTLINRT